MQLQLGALTTEIVVQAPWQNPPAKEDFRAASLVMVGMGQGNASLTKEALDAIEPGLLVVVPANTLVPFASYHVSEHYVTIAISGTRNFLQWILHVLGSVQGSFPNYPGSVNLYFGATADSFIGAVGADIIAALNGRQLVCLGHSFGAAVAQLLLTYFGPHATNGAIGVVFGSPRVGDLIFASAVDGKVFRIEDTLDPVIQLPPASWFGQGSPWQPFPGLVPAVYVHGGSAMTLDDEGNLTDGSQPLPLAQVWVMIQAQDVPSHQISEYARRLQLVIEPPPVAFVDPSELDLVAGFIFPQLFLGGDGVATVQGIMYFTTNEESAGWQESWFLNGTPQNMMGILQGLLTQRAACLAGDCSIIALKASIVDPPPAARQSILQILTTPVKGGGTNIKAQQGVQQTNITLDAIDYLCTSAAASRKVYTFRGVPDEWVAASALTDVGRAAGALFQSYLLAAQTATLGLRIYTRNAGGGRKPNVAIANQAGSGLILITATAHGYPVNPAFYQVTIRGCRSNPMLNGKWKAQTVDANTFVLQGSQRFQGNAMNDGSSQLYAFNVDQLSGFQFNRVGTRKTGKVFNQRRGKRSPRLLHH